MLELRSGPMELTLAPEIGGSIASLRHDGVDLLRPMPRGAASPLESACFPLVPYANRIADGRVSTAGRAAVLAPNMAGQPHPLHGDGWLAPWTVARADSRSVTLSFTPQAGGWPWAYVARQVFTLTDDALTVEISVTSLDEAEGPFGLGFHPYFPNRDTARMTARLTGLWLTDPEHLPTRHVEGWPFVDWRGGAGMASERLIDHCHTGWDGTALIDLGGDRRTLRLTASPELSCLHIYSPPGEDFFCVEPVSHRPNVVNAGEQGPMGMRRLAPNDTFSVWMKLQVGGR